MRMDAGGKRPTDRPVVADSQECDQLARTLALASPPEALDLTSRTLVVEPRSRHIARSLRAVGFRGPLEALASVPVGERYGLAADYQRVVVDDWTGHALSHTRGAISSGGLVAPAQAEAQSSSLILGQFDTILVIDVSRYAPPAQAPDAVRWLCGLLADGGRVAVVDPATTLTPDRLAASLGEWGMTQAGEARMIEGDWTRMVTIWRQTAEARDLAATSAAYAAQRGAGALYAAGGSDPRHTPPGAPAAFRRDQMMARRGALIVTPRPGTGLTMIVARDGALLPAERSAISRYRLEQYVLANLYSAELVERLGITEDPSMALLTGNDTHFVAATEDGVVASYMCLQDASSALAQRMLSERSGVAPKAHAPVVAGAKPSGVLQWSSSGALTLAERARPMFPVETEYGDLYARHPGMGTLPVASVREITRLVRNQRPDLRAHLREVADIAVAETIIASALYVIDPANLVEAVVGCIAPEARHALLNFRVPVAYAPNAPILGDNLGGGATGGPLIWTEESNAVGRFWPFAIAVLDVRRDAAYYAALDDALNGRSAREAREAVNTLRRHTPLRSPRFAASFTYEAYREEAGGHGYSEVTLPVAWMGLETRPRVYDHNVSGENGSGESGLSRAQEAG